MSGFKRCAGLTKNKTQCAKYMKEVKYSTERNGILYPLCNTHRDASEVVLDPMEYDEKLKLKSPKNGKYRCNGMTKGMNRCKNTYNEEGEYCTLHKKRDEMMSASESIGANRINEIESEIKDERLKVLERKLKTLDCKNEIEMRSILEEVYGYFKEKKEMKETKETKETKGMKEIVFEEEEEEEEEEENYDYGEMTDMARMECRGISN